MTRRNRLTVRSLHRRPGPRPAGRHRPGRLLLGRRPARAPARAARARRARPRSTAPTPPSSTGARPPTTPSWPRRSTATRCAPCACWPWCTWPSTTPWPPSARPTPPTRCAERAPDADPVAAAASAAFEVLVAELPGQRATLAARLARRPWTALPDGAARDKGVALGQRAAAAILRARQRRRRGHARDRALHAGAAEQAGRAVYRPVPPVDFMAAPGWRSLQPFGLQSPQQFRVAPPPALDSAEYATAFEEVKRMGGKGSTARSADQTGLREVLVRVLGHRLEPRRPHRRHRAQAGAAGHRAPVRPAEHGACRTPTWPGGTRSSTTTSGARPPPSAGRRQRRQPGHRRRPDLAVRGGDPAGAGLPLHPQRPGRRRRRGAGPRVRRRHAVHLHLHHRGARRAARAASPASPQAADENADSRVQAGLHFRFACQAGQALGRQVGAWVVATQLRPAP